MKWNPAIFWALYAVVTAAFGPSVRAQENIQRLVEHPERIFMELAGHTTQEAAHLILRTLDAIEEAGTPGRHKGKLIARTVGCAVYALNGKAPEVFGTLGPDIREERLTLVVASAVMSAGPYSMQLVDAMFEQSLSHSQRRKIEEAARQPTKYLTWSQIRECRSCAFGMRPLPIRPLLEDPERASRPPLIPDPPTPAPPYGGQ